MLVTFYNMKGDIVKKWDGVEAVNMMPGAVPVFQMISPLQRPMGVQTLEPGGWLEYGPDGPVLH